ncbi:hypothetical protein OO013_08410 [Mangrovivirga sp. M17]|uniref:Uncharacterized protein n=1 Tax=Mangrovivirga halotolerans TaxID=2993936 RepID=A0ABT3RQ15_9BACT|nr:hypothetical protein [Mangrovivirga halotolerans]MCX2743885.1 hypothetical protein [Mangrovivirga halotolerans]
MNRKNKINLISILLLIISVIMIYLGIKNNIAPPTLTGVGFILIIWAIQEFEIDRKK